MSVSNGQPGNATTFNTGFMSRTVDDNTTGKKDLANTDPASGASVVNVQREINSHNAYSGRPSGSAHDATPIWNNTEVGTSTDTLKARAEALTLEFNTTSGHTHNGTDSKAISATDLLNINQFVAAYQSVEKTAASGTSIDVSTEFTGLVNGGGSAALGVLTDAPDNKVQIIDLATGTAIEGAGGQRVYGRLTWAASVWTLSFFTNEAGVETAHSLASTDITIFYREVFNLATRPTIPADIGEIGSLDMTADVVDASPTQRGVVSTGVQSFAGDKTFDDDISANNLSGTNTGDVTLAAIGVTPNANGGSLSGQILNLQPADASFGGAVSTLAQTFAGDKTFQDFIEAQSELFGAYESDNATTGADQTLPIPVKLGYRLTLTTLASIEGITAPSKAQFFILVNTKGSSLLVKNDVGTAANRIITGSGADITLLDNATLWLAYDTITAKWRVVGGSGGSASPLTTKGDLYTYAAADERLPVGTDGQVLSADSAEATGLKWVTNNAKFTSQNFTGTSITGTADGFQRHRYTGVSAQTLASISVGSLVDGSILNILGLDDTNTLTLDQNDTANGWLLNGSWTGFRGSMLSLQWDATLARFIEVSRNA